MADHEVMGQMIKTLTFAKRASGITRADFRAWYENDYVDKLRGQSAGLERHLRNHVLHSHQPSGWEPNFDVVDERWYAGRAQLDLARAAGGAAAVRDYLDEALTRTFVVSEFQSELPPTSYEFGAKLILMLNRHDLYDRPSFRDRYEHGHALLAAKMLAPALLRYERNYLVEPLTPGWEDEFDVVTSFEFAAGLPRRGSDKELAYLIRDEEVFMDRSSQRFIQVDPQS